MVKVFSSSSSSCGGQPRAGSGSYHSPGTVTSPGQVVGGPAFPRSVEDAPRSADQQRPKVGLPAPCPRTVCAEAKILQPALPDPRRSAFLCFPSPSVLSLTPSLPRAQPCAVGSPCSGVCDLSPLPSSFFLSRPCRPPRPAAESCHPGTGLPSSPPPFTWMTDSIFSSRVCHSACGFEPHCLASRIMELQETVNAGLWSLSRTLKAL